MFDKRKFNDICLFERHKINERMQNSKVSMLLVNHKSSLSIGTNFPLEKNNKSCTTLQSADGSDANEILPILSQFLCHWDFSKCDNTLIFITVKSNILKGPDQLPKKNPVVGFLKKNSYYANLSGSLCLLPYIHSFAEASVRLFIIAHFLSC